ncbi:MAG TPA: flagellar biosynthesis anti-sigma factor FlgM [Pseudogracilibacillus sp.]|nr:flagellar biosynthesis anti-sigma factor FlgM [Pseudogracilibacillus sp.]
MKIQGSNPYLNAYSQSTQQHTNANKTVSVKDEANISFEAMKIQGAKQQETERSAYVKEIKESVKNGEYKIDHEQLAQKMIDFWTGTQK